MVVRSFVVDDLSDVMFAPDMDPVTSSTRDMFSGSLVANGASAYTTAGRCFLPNMPQIVVL